MKLRNKKTGEIKELPDGFFCGDNLKKFCEEWEDCEEPKRTWFIDTNCGPNYIDYGDNPITDHCYDDWNELGICFETKEEAELAVRKLKAWKRLKDKGMIIYSFEKSKPGIDLDFYTLTILAPRDKDSLDLLFGGGE